jgi:hypothetical protein
MRRRICLHDVQDVIGVASIFVRTAPSTAPHWIRFRLFQSIYNSKLGIVITKRRHRTAKRNIPSNSVAKRSMSTLTRLMHIKITFPLARSLQWSLLCHRLAAFAEA